MTPYTIHDLGTRAEQQDRFSVTLGKDGPTCLVVVDGMGGHERGADAADAALSEFCLHVTTMLRLQGPAVALRQALVSAAEKVHTLRRTGDIRGPGACLTALVRHGDDLWLAHVGDTMLWAFKGENWWLQSAQHQEGKHGLITLCLGGGTTPEEVGYDAHVKRIDPADGYLLATDGLVHSERRRAGYSAHWAPVDPPDGDCDEGTLGRLLERARRDECGDNATGILWTAGRR